jgi:predicted RNA-binding protein with PUA-like domain
MSARREARRNTVAKKHWLMKSEPEVYSITQLERDGVTLWTGVRNYQARNFMMQEMQPGETVLFYHSNAEPPGVAGLATISQQAVPDPTQFDPKSEYFDKKASPTKPIWFCVEVKFAQKFPQVLPLDEIRKIKGLDKMHLLQKGSRLSIQPVTDSELKVLLKKVHS